MSAVVPSRDERVLVLAPTGRDAPLTCSLLAERAHVCCEQVNNLSELAQRMQEGAGTAVIAEEALEHPSFNKLADVLRTRGFPLARLARNLELCADVLMDRLGEPATPVAARLRVAAALAR